MKYILIIGFILLSCQASASAYLGCGLGVNHTAIASADWLKHRADDLAMVQCWLESSPAIEAQGFFKSLPSMHWQTSKPSTFSRRLSQETSKQQAFELQWPFFRQDTVILGVMAGVNDIQQQQRIHQDLQWLAPNNLLSAGQPVFIRQQEQFFGVFLDTKLADILFDQISIKRQYIQLPIKISYLDPNAAAGSDPSAFLSEVKTQHWQIEVRKRPHGHGLLGYWGVSLGSGEVSSSVYPRAEMLDAPYFISAKWMLGLQWRYRVSSNLHPYIDLNSSHSYWFFSKNSNQTYTVDKTAQANIQASVGVSWRF